MIESRLISNSNYHVVLMPSGGGYSHWGALAVTRRREDAALEGVGVLVFLHESATGSTWSPVAGHPSRDHEIDTALSVAVDGDANLELRRLRSVGSVRRRTDGPVWRGYN